jgi:hypothetical protein
MISRRRLLILLGFLGLPTIRASAEVERSLPPHCEALSLVWSVQAEFIKAAELRHAKAEQSKRKEYVSPESRWWFDAEGRSWEVARPFEPGGIDSTHMFRVRYLINGQAVAAWNVDTREKEVSVIK